MTTTKLKNRFKNRFKMIPILNGEYQYRSDYNVSDFKLSVGISLAKYESKKAIDEVCEFQEWFARMGGMIENEDMEKVIERFL